MRRHVTCEYELFGCSCEKTTCATSMLLRLASRQVDMNGLTGECFPHAPTVATVMFDLGLNA